MMRYPIALFAVLVFLSSASSGRSEAADAAAAVKRVEALGGKVRYDAGKRPVGVDLLECQTTDADVKLLARWPACGSWRCRAPRFTTPASSRSPPSPS